MPTFVTEAEEWAEARIPRYPTTGMDTMQTITNNIIGHDGRTSTSTSLQEFPSRPRSGTKGKAKAQWNSNKAEKLCSVDGCTNHAKKGGVCMKHVAKVKLCSEVGCPNVVRKGGVCMRHGANVKRCSHDGCTNFSMKEGVCWRHGAKDLIAVKKCSSEGCTNNVANNGVCVRHGAKLKFCSSEGCTNRAVKGGVCIKHGAKAARCSKEGCTNQAQIGGVCIRHGAIVKANRCSHEGCTNRVINKGVCVRHGATRSQRKICRIEGCGNYSMRGGVCRRHGAYSIVSHNSTTHRYQARKSDQQSQTSKSLTLPNIVLCMKDKDYAKVMNEFIKILDGMEYNATVEEMGGEILLALKQKFHIADENGDSIDDKAALQKLVQCLNNQCSRIQNMPKLGIGSPNASIYPKMRPEPPEPVSYTKYFEDEDEDEDVSSTAAVNEADDDANEDDANEEKKRSATEDDNPGATKKSKADGEGEQILAAPPGCKTLFSV